MDDVALERAVIPRAPCEQPAGGGASIIIEMRTCKADPGKCSSSWMSFAPSPSRRTEIGMKILAPADLGVSTRPPCAASRHMKFFV